MSNDDDVKSSVTTLYDERVRSEDDMTNRNHIRILSKKLSDELIAKKKRVGALNVIHPTTIQANYDLPTTVDSDNNRIYVLGYDTLHGYSFVSKPPWPSPAIDGPLEMRVPTDCTITLVLQNYSELSWSFDEPAIFIETADAGWYANLEQVYSGDGNCYQVFFYARFDTSEPEGTKHNFDINLLNPPSGTGTIDPDVKNPGDDPSKMMAQRRSSLSVRLTHVPSGTAPSSSRDRRNQPF